MVWWQRAGGREGRPPGRRLGATLMPAGRGRQAAEAAADMVAEGTGSASPNLWRRVCLQVLRDEEDQGRGAGG